MTGRDDDLFSYSRSSDPETSAEAAERILPHVSDLQMKVLRIVAKYGPPSGPPFCQLQICHYLPEQPLDSISPRLSELRNKGLLRCLGPQPRENRYGKLRNQLVYEITDFGRTFSK